MPVTNIRSNWSGGDLIFHETGSKIPSTTYNVFEIADDAVKVGDTANDIDFQYYGTGSLSAIIDCGAATFTLVGIATSTNGAVTITNATATSSTTTGALIVTGGIATAADITCGDDLFMSNGGVINFNSGDVTITHSSGALAVAATWATPAATGRPFGVTLTVNAALGAYSNALKGYVAYGTSGYTTGLGSAVNAEILLSTGTTQGNYAPLESELVADSAVSTGTATGFLYGNIAGTNSTGKTTLNTNAHLFILGTGVVDTSSGLFDSITSGTPEFTHRFRVLVGGTAYYIGASTSATFGD